jgi:GNAT superfamily N-acetyltransferase
MKFRQATYQDIEEIITLLNDDIIGETREITTAEDIEHYKTAFSEISSDSNNYIYVVTDNDVVIGLTQLFIMPHISRKGTKRAQIESVRIAKEYRGKGVGKKFMNYIIDIAKNEDCKLIQLTTDKIRDDARRFYTQLGFEDSHIGMKRHL